MSHDKNNHQQNGHHDHHDHHAQMVKDFRLRFWISLVLTLPILALSPMIQNFFGFGLRFPTQKYWIFGFSSAVFFYGGWPFLKGLWDELKKKQPGMMTLIAVAIGVAYIYSSAVVFGLSGKTFFWELATLVDIMLLGHLIEMKSVMGASKALTEMAQLLPKDAHRLDDNGKTEDVPVDELKKGDRLLIKPGEKVPADGRVVEGESTVNEAMVTGESEPQTKKEGDEVVGGTVNGDSSLTIEVEKSGDDSFLSQAMKLVQEAQQSKSRTQNLADRAAFWLTLIALSAGAITFAAWFGWAGREFVYALERSVTVMVITCPHALGLAIPLVVAVSTAKSSQNGLLIRNRAAFEKARLIDAILFDKTGTLTKGSFGVSDILPLDDSLSEKEILRLAAAVEQNSEHPIAKGIVEKADDYPSVKDFDSIPGKGAKGTVDGKEVAVVSPGYLRENDIDIPEKASELQEDGKTVVFVLRERQTVGAIALADEIRDESKETIDALHDMGIRCMMLTGDNQKVAKRVAGELGLDEVFAEVLPQDKEKKVREVQENGYVVAMTGDGVNDAPALARADVGIAIGAGTDVAVETADIILVRSNPKDVLALLKFARATYRKMQQNLAWATGYNVIAIPLAAGVLFSFGIILSPAVGAVLMSLSTVIVAINARFLKVEK